MAKSLTIAMVSDFFHPNVGGVESHIYELSQCLIARGHKVIVVTHQYVTTKLVPSTSSAFSPPSTTSNGEQCHRELKQYCSGVRFLPCGMKVYYLPWRAFYNQCIFPTFFGTFPIFREIFLRENVDLVHGHSAFSTLGHEAMFHASCMGLHTVFTDHSLFGFADVSSILTNKVLQVSLANVNKVICVSHTSKENTVLRAYLDPRRVYVIPNAVEAELFTPRPECRDLNYVTIVVLSRLVYRKGIDFLEELIPSLCQKYATLRFLVAGDGPKRLMLEEVREKHQLENRVILLGAIPHEKTPEVLVQGDIFLNTSLTEAFCIAILEAVCCGLDVVSTSVGGIPEVLPENDAVCMVAPKVQSLEKALCKAIDHQLEWRSRVGRGASPAELSQSQSTRWKHEIASIEQASWKRHYWVRDTYNWHQVAERTERVYEAAVLEAKAPLKVRLSRMQSCGPICGLVMKVAMLLHFLVYISLERFRPASNVPSIDQTIKQVIQRERDNQKKAL